MNWIRRIGILWENWRCLHIMDGCSQRNQEKLLLGTQHTKVEVEGIYDNFHLLRVYWKTCIDLLLNAFNSVWGLLKSIDPCLSVCLLKKEAINLTVVRSNNPDFELFQYPIRILYYPIFYTICFHIPIFRWYILNICHCSQFVFHYISFVISSELTKKTNFLTLSLAYRIDIAGCDYLLSNVILWFKWTQLIITMF